MQSTNIKTIVREISNAVGALEDSGIDCKLSVIWSDVDSVRVIVSIECEDLMLIDASLTGTPDRPDLLVDLLQYLTRLSESVANVNTV